MGKLDLTSAGLGGLATVDRTPAFSTPDISNGIEATERLGGPELAYRGTREAYASIYRAIRGDRDDKHKDNVESYLSQLVNNTTGIGDDAVVVGI